MTAPTYYNEQTYGTAYAEDPQAMSPNALNTAADFVEGLCFWAGATEERTEATYRTRIRNTAAALEAAAYAADGHTGNAYNRAARQLTDTANNTDWSEPRAAMINHTYKNAQSLRRQALSEHSRRTKYSEEHTRETMRQRDREHDDRHRPTT